MSSGDRCVTVAMHGELDATAAVALTGQLASLCAGNPWMMVADMRGVTMIDGDGVTAIVDACRALRSRYCDLVISGSTAEVQGRLELVGLRNLESR